MGNIISSFFQSGSALLSSSNQRSVSETTQNNIQQVFEILRANPKIPIARLETLLAPISRYENLTYLLNQEGYNIFQKAVGINHTELVKWCVLQQGNSSLLGCSYPLHIACLRGYQDSVEILLKHGAKIDHEAKMCWPGRHKSVCPEFAKSTGVPVSMCDIHSFEKAHDAFIYAIEGDQVGVLTVLLAHRDASWFPWQRKRPLLLSACKKGAWNCMQYLADERSDEINICYDEWYPIHQAVLHHTKFVEYLLARGANIQVKTNTSQMTLLHCVFLLRKKSADDTFEMVKFLLERGLKEYINEADSLGNTPLHALIIRYALEEARFGFTNDPNPWNKWEMLRIVHYLLNSGASPSINKSGNSALACVLRHIKDWEFRYDIIQMLLSYGGNPNHVGRDGSAPLMVCLVPLINKDPFIHITHSMKVSYLNCVRILCKYGANTNIPTSANLTPLHVLMYTASETIPIFDQKEKATAFSFINQLLVILLKHGLNPNVRFTPRTKHILFSMMDMVNNARTSLDLDYVYQITLILLQFGANPNINISTTEPLIFHSQSSVFLKKPSNQVLYYYVQLLIRKEDVLVDEDYRFSRVMNLYYMAMEHKELHQCLKILHTQTALVPMKSALANVIRDLYTKPRTLKQICRVTIYECIGRRSKEIVPKLPLPISLKNYIINFEP